MHQFSFTSEPLRTHKSGKFTISDFMGATDANMDQSTVNSFGEEWSKFNSFSEQDIKTAGDQYFDIVEPFMLGKEKIAMDLGCGSGRWSKYLAPRIGFIEAVDPSDAVFAAANLLNDVPNVRISKASANNIPFPDESFDFILSLGVLHHIPDTANAMQHAAKKLKKNGYFHIYLYYALDNRGILFRTIFNISNIFRKIISALPAVFKKTVCDLIAIVIYLPFILFAKFIKIFSKEEYKKIPLSYYTDKRFYIIRNDALDRFGTPLEQRFSKEDIRQMMQRSGLSDIIFSEHAPYWHAVGKKA